MLTEDYIGPTQDVYKMKTNYNLKTVIIVTMLVGLVLMSGFAVAKNEKWYEKETPSTLIKFEDKQKLITTKDQYVWNTTRYWKESNCYYFDLMIGNSTNVTWTDSRRELKCTTETLTDSEIDALQAENIAWTLGQLSQDTPVVVITNVKKEKSEDLKKGSVSDNGITMDAVSKQIIVEEELAN